MTEGESGLLTYRLQDLAVPAKEDSGERTRTSAVEEGARSAPDTGVDENVPEVSLPRSLVGSLDEIVLVETSLGQRFVSG